MEWVMFNSTWLATIVLQHAYWVNKVDECQILASTLHQDGNADANQLQMRLVSGRMHALGTISPIIGVPRCSAMQYRHLGVGVANVDQSGMEALRYHRSGELHPKSVCGISH